MKINKIKNYIKLFWQMLKTDLIIMKQDILGSILDSVILVGVLIVIFSYIFPAFIGASKYFGSFALAGMLASIPTFTMFAFVAKFIADIEGNNSVSYYLTLPIPSWLVFMKSAVANAIRTALMSIVIIPLGKLILWNRLDLSNIVVIKFVLIFFGLNLFYSLFSVFLFSVPKNMDAIRSIWIRIIFPLWFLGGAEFPWQTIYNLNKPLAYFALLNPLLYPMEGIRAAFFGQKGFISFWLCFVALFLFSLFFIWLGIKRLKKRLDFI